MEKLDETINEIIKNLEILNFKFHSLEKTIKKLDSLKKEIYTFQDIPKLIEKRGEETYLQFLKKEWEISNKLFSDLKSEIYYLINKSISILKTLK